jgi:diguanylate cyclase (GGDEF)-like protein
MSMDDAMAARAVAGIRRFIPAGWALSRQSSVFIGYALAVEATVLLVTATTAITVPIHLRDLVMLAVLAGMGVLQAEIGQPIERMRRRLVDHDTPHFNLTSVWTFGGVMLLPPALITVLVAVLYGHLAVRSWYGLRNMPPFRSAFNASLAVLSSCASYGVLHLCGVDGIRGALERGWGSLGGISFAIGTYFIVAALIVLPGLKPATRTFRELFGGLIDNVLELATLLAGAFAALALETLSFLIVALIALMYFVHRSVLVTQLEVLASTDEKTGLFNARGWHQIATETLNRAERERGRGAVLMVDVDRFKRINDKYGHQTGDDVLNAIAKAIHQSVREYDAVGRFGGEEFVVLLPDITLNHALAVADRIRDAVSKYVIVSAKALNGRRETIRNLSVSIGVAPYPEISLIPDVLIGAADTALMEAKLCGRNRVRVSTA